MAVLFAVGPIASGFSSSGSSYQVACACQSCFKQAPFVAEGSVSQSSTQTVVLAAGIALPWLGTDSVNFGAFVVAQAKLAE